MFDRLIEIKVIVQSLALMAVIFILAVLHRKLIKEIDKWN